MTVIGGVVAKLVGWSTHLFVSGRWFESFRYDRRCCQYTPRAFIREMQALINILDKLSAGNWIEPLAADKKILGW